MNFFIYLYKVCANHKSVSLLRDGAFLFLFVFTSIFVLSHEVNAQPVPFVNSGVNTNFGKIPKRLLLNQGLVKSADIQNALTNAIPVGDGTYYFRADLVQGAAYNFIFQAKVNGSWYYEQLPPRGTFPLSIDLPGGVSDKAGGTIVRTSDNNIRRSFTVPISGSAAYLFCNFGHHPNPPNVTASPLDGKILLQIRSSGRWGNSEPDVEYGGSYALYKSTIDKGPYQFLARLPGGMGSVSAYTDSAVGNSTNYFYVVMASDAYNNTNVIIRRGPFDKEVSLPDNDSFVNQENIDANMYSGYSSQAGAVPRQAVRVIFKVENIDWDTVHENQNIVYLTPWEEDGRIYIDKPSARIVRVSLKQ